MAPVDPSRLWAASGAMHLTGHPSGATLGPPTGLVDRVGELAADVAHLSGALGDPVELDGLALLGERAAIAGLSRRGQTNCGGASRLLRAEDGWLTVSLPRHEDRDLVPAWLGVDVLGDPWAELARHLTRQPAADMAAWGAELGLAVAALPASPPPRDAPVVAHRIADAAPTTSLRSLVVVDLSALWAGPLCGSLLADAGATVIKVESTRRPDGSRRGPAAFFDLLNAGKRSVAIDLTSAAGHHALLGLLRRADVVIEASRPRALEQMGIDATTLLAEEGPRAWVSITGHGRGPGPRERVGFGDDAAVAGGLVAWDGEDPVFCADAVADPLSGLAAAGTVLRHLRQGGCWLLDVALSRTAAWCAGPTLTVDGDVHVATPRARSCRGVGPALGADTDEVLGRSLHL